MNSFVLLSLALFVTTESFHFNKALYNVKKSSLLNFIERIYKNSEIFPGSSLIQYPKQVDYLGTNNTNSASVWYTIGNSKDFLFGTSQKITIEDQTFIVWKKDINEFVGLSDTCSHGGGSLSEGRISGNNIECPNHKNIYNENGECIQTCDTMSENACLYNVNNYSVVESNHWVYLNKNSFYNPIVSVPYSINFNDIYSINYADEIFLCDYETVITNALDLIHSIFTDFFGNIRINALSDNKPSRVGINHYKMEYLYESDKYSLAKYAFDVNNITIKNEYLYPYTTITTINMNRREVIIMASTLPISKNKTKLFIKCYRNFWHSTMGTEIIAILLNSVLSQHSTIVNNMPGKITIENLKQKYRTLYEDFHSTNQL
jgi:nitrite reductase/ring-hydroxylating ferredoxin subunit